MKSLLHSTKRKKAACWTKPKSESKRWEKGLLQYGKTWWSKSEQGFDISCDHHDERAQGQFKKSIYKNWGLDNHLWAASRIKEWGSLKDKIGKKHKSRYPVPSGIIKAALCQKLRPKCKSDVCDVAWCGVHDERFYAIKSRHPSSTPSSSWTLRSSLVFSSLINIHTPASISQVRPGILAVVESLETGRTSLMGSMTVPQRSLLFNA